MTALHEQLALTFANQAAVALDNARLFQETRARASALDEQAQRLALLNRVSLALAQTLDLENIYEIALREVAIALNAAEGSAMQVDNENNLGDRGGGVSARRCAARGDYNLLEYEAIERVRDNLIPLVVDLTENQPGRPISLRPMLRRDDIQASLLVPMVVGGEVIGILRLDCNQRRSAPSHIEQIELAQTITSQAATAVQNAGLFEQGQIRTRELETLFESAQATAVTLDLDEVMRRVTIQMLAAVGADACTVFLWDDVNNLLEVRGEISSRPEGVPPDQPGEMCTTWPIIPLREKALRDRELIIVRADETESAARRSRTDGTAPRRQPHAGAAGRQRYFDWAGGSRNARSDPPLSEGETVRLARTLASQAAISIENARLQTETRRTVEELYIINDMSGGAVIGYQPARTAGGDRRAASQPDRSAGDLRGASTIKTRTQITFPMATSVRDDRPFDVPPCPFGKDEFSLIIRQKAPLLLAG